MADHFSGPRALADPASDITDVFTFPSPERPGHLVLVMDVFPSTTATALFSDALTYRFRLRPLTATTAGGRPAFAAGADEYAFDVTFAVPSSADGPDGMVQAGTCTIPGGAEIPFRVGVEKPTEDQGVRVFAGPRLDPFFLDLAAEQATHDAGAAGIPAQGRQLRPGRQRAQHRPRARHRHGARPRHRPAAGRGRRDRDLGGHPVRLERMGRPEIKNFILQDKKYDSVNRDLEIRDLYNAEDAFDLGPTYLGAYRARLNANLPFFDRLDGRTDWPPDDQGVHPLTELLLADFLVVDTPRSRSPTAASSRSSGPCSPAARTPPPAADHPTTTSWTFSTRCWSAAWTDRGSATASTGRPSRRVAASPT